MTSVEDILKTAIEATEEDAQQFGVKGMKWGVRRKVDTRTGLVARTDSADQINANRIQKKLASGGTAALSNQDLKQFAERIRLEQEFNRLTQTPEAQKGQNFVAKFLQQQGNRQFHRVADKAIDVAIEKALEEAGIRVGKKGGNPDVADLMVKTSKRLAPKKK